MYDTAISGWVSRPRTGGPLPVYCLKHFETTPPKKC